MLKNNNLFKYETPYKGPFEITQSCTNDADTFQCGVIKIRHNICHIKAYTYDTTLKILFMKMMYDNVNILMDIYALLVIYINDIK